MFGRRRLLEVLAVMFLLCMLRAVILFLDVGAITLPLAFVHDLRISRYCNAQCLNDEIMRRGTTRT